MFLEESRQHVIGLLEEGYPPEKVSEMIGCSPRSMPLWMRHFEDNVTVWRDPRLRNCSGFCLQSRRGRTPSENPAQDVERHKGERTRTPGSQGAKRTRTPELTQTQC